MSPPVYATATSTPSGHAPAAIPVFPSGGPAGHRGTGSPPVVRRAVSACRTPGGAGCRSGSGGSARRASVSPLPGCGPSSPPACRIHRGGRHSAHLPRCGYQQLTELHRYLLAIQNAPVPGKSALKAVQLRLDQNSSDPIFATRQMAKTLPAPLNRWVGRLTDQAWHVVMVEAVHYMEVDWRDSVVKPFNEQLANNYPFNPRSAQDASLDAFERFFKPDGILDTFYQQNLKLFIDNDLSLEDGDNNVIIREDIIAQLETAQKIRDIFFSKQNGLGTSFAVETVSLSGNKRRSVLNLDGQLVDYSQGRNYTAHLVWPNNMREGNESKLTLIGTSGNAPRSISFSGPWAQFRLFGAGQLTGVQDGNFTVRFSVDGGAMTYRVHTDTEDNPFSGGLFSQFGLSDTLY